MTTAFRPSPKIRCWDAFASRRKGLAAAGALLCFVLVSAARADSPTNQSPPVEARTAGDTNAIATYDGGSITAGEVAEYIGEPHFSADADQNAPPNAAIGQDEKLARHLAALRILVNAARQKGLAGAGWRVEVKLIEQGVLAQALTDEIRRGVIVSDQEVNEQYGTNRFKLLGFQTVEAGRIGISAKKHGDKALERAKEALALIRGGQDFAAMATQYSDLEPKLAQKETYPADFWGKPGGMVLAELGEGKVSDPLPVPDGFELVKVERIYLKDNPGPEEAKVKLHVMLNELAAEERLGEMSRSAEIAFPLVAAQTNPPPSSTLNLQPSTNVVLLRCGQFALTKEDIRAFARQRWLHEADEQALPENLKQEYGYQMQMGELARSMGFDKRPNVQKALHYELDKQLAAKAQTALLPELAAGLTFEEGRIRKAYDETFTATFDALLQYDMLVVPMGVPPNATAEEREAARTNALAKAQDVIRQVQGGAGFDQVAASDPSWRLMRGQSRVVPDSSALAPLVAGLNPGEVAAQPYEDFGGYGVIRVSKYEPRRKMPYEIARNYILDSFRNEALPDLRKNFETVLLNKYHFAYGPSAAARLRDSASAATGKTNNQQ
jgi:hypothetical protein